MVLTAGIIEITVSVIGFAGVSLTAYFGMKSKQLTAQLEQAHVQIKNRGSSFTTVAASWEYIRSQVKEIVETTKADRFLLLSSNNGYLDPKWATATVQIREGEQYVFVYRDYEIDNDYRQKLTQIKSDGYAIYSTAGMPKSRIKSVYEREEVKYTFWFYLSSRNVPGTKIYEVNYFSISTHEDEKFTEQEIQRFISFGNELRGVERNYANENKI